MLLKQRNKSRKITKIYEKTGVKVIDSKHKKPNPAGIRGCIELFKFITKIERLLWLERDGAIKYMSEKLKISIFDLEKVIY